MMMLMMMMMDDEVNSSKLLLRPGHGQEFLSCSQLWVEMQSHALWHHGHFSARALEIFSCGLSLRGERRWIRRHSSSST